MAQHPRTDWEKVTSDLRKSKTSKADQSDAPPTNLSLDLDSIMPESGQAEDVANVPTLKLAEPDVLPDAALTPEGQSLRDFQSTLTNTPEERANVSNLMQFWERIPRYNCSDIQGINNSPDAKEMGIVNYSFEDSGEHYTLEMTPAQIRTEANGVQQTIFCYPDNTDELVELALVKLAMDNGDILQPADISHKPAKGHAALPSYGVYFTINQLIQQLKHWGRGRSYPALMRSLEVLNKCNLSVRSTSKGGINARGAILPELVSFEQNGFDAHDRNGFWTARFHPIISLGIHAGLYQQYNVFRVAQVKTHVGHAIIKLLLLNGRNISEQTPYSLKLSSLQETTGLLNYKSPYHARRKFREHIQRIEAEGLLSHVEFVEKKRGKRVIDVEARMFASASLVREMKASHKRSNIIGERRYVRAAIQKTKV
ncbi:MULTISPECIES: hypothetical protein [Halomonadaceae]|uniref:Replication initiator protein A n=1 Tax=Halomonas casei TaxID=2742613 RepID=A0ABR9F5H0_9GAMM|nr:MULTISPECIES: hypothetical protein [Halomonas]MBE0401359.1 hypothetical protein [Halomonas casei]WKD30472.1 hypothetical protein NDQ72_20430 [Halomonas sp. KG2]